ncbi:hypothetical protein BDAP_001163 [Binucleata daphniae]
MLNYNEYYNFEKEVLKKFVYRIKNEHKSTMIYRKIVHLHRLTRNTDIEKITSLESQTIQRCCSDLYILATSYIALGHYLGFTYIVLGLCGRFHFLVGKLYYNKKQKLCDDNEIDAIFK